jgi:hypothetical protein
MKTSLTALLVRKKFFLIIMTLGIYAEALYAQYDVDNRIKLELTPYVWMTEMNGELTLNGETRAINFTYSDFLKYSNLGLNGLIELKINRWAIFFSYNFADLLKDKTYIAVVFSELAFAWRLTKDFELIVGGRYFKSDIEYKDLPVLRQKGKQIWIDPIIGGRISLDITRKFVFSARADVGGFGVGSVFGWSLMTSVGYQISNITFALAYRIWYANYKHSSGENLFAYDVTTSGPGLAMMLHF